jgi:hypothetical protein
MSEIKNNFISSKMNQDIDDRLMPNNEYRYALNLEVNRSENSDVGTLQNILGNSLAVDFNDVAETTGLECIGVCVDESNDNIYVFLTDYKDIPYSPTAQNYIYVYNNKQVVSPTFNPILLASGAFLNFSTQFPIYGVNLIENLLFWTDNRNQPRKINVNRAANNPGYYWNEEQISVAKLNPLHAPELYRVSPFGLPLAATATVGTVTGSGPYTATITPGTPFSSDLLSIGDTIHATVGTSSLTKGVVTNITTSGPNITSFIISSVSSFTSGSITLLYVDQYETSMYDVVSPYLPDGTTPNPYLKLNWPGDPAYLEGRYVRFSYRYKFEDAEYSIMAPFTQIAYIPKQDGFFMYNASSSPTINDEESAYRSTIVGFMQNKVNDILLQIILPCPANELYSKYKIVEIEILYKEADDVAVAAVDAIPTIPIPSKGSTYVWNTTATTYSYDYPSKKPFKTLPSRDVIRVNDIVPVKALSQEIVGNRVVYGNYQDKYTYPKYLNYNAGVSEKSPFGFGSGKGTSVIEYPNHSVKENRNYQIGVVFGDKFGRESGVILSDQLSSFDNSFGASSLYLPYTGENEIIPYDWFGNSLKVLFNQQIQPAAPDPLTGWPGLYNGDDTDVNYNPLGWYSYKIVVKQTEQDYYNVYLPGVMAAYPNNATLELGKTSHTVLLNDNINKVPRDLTEVGPAQKQFRSSVILFPRVNNNTLTYGNQQYYPGNEYAFASTIATNNSLFFPDGVSPSTPPAGFENFYQIDSDPLIARISTVQELGVVTTSPNNVIKLAVYETKPIQSKLDIYWESSTSGLISELNTAIQEGSDSSVDSVSGWSFSLSEADGPGTPVTTQIVFKDILGAEITPTNVVIQSVFTGTGANVSDKFFIEQVGISNKYIVKTKVTPTPAYFYYGYNATNAERYSFTIQATVGTPPISNSFVLTGQLSNVTPTITNKPSAPINKSQGAVNVYDFNAVNGSNPSGGNSTADLSWTVTGDPIFTITSAGILQDLSGLAEGTFNLRVTVMEASGATDYVDITVIYPYRNSIVFSSWFSQSGTGSSNMSTSGTVTITGTPANFNAYSTVNTGSASVTTDVIINGVSLSAFRNTIGTTSSSVLTLSAGTYPYSVEVDRVASGFAVSGGGINAIQ